MKFPEYDEVLGKIADRQKKLAAIFDEAGPDIDFTKVKSVEGDSTAVRDAVKALNAELNELGQRRDDLAPVKEAAERNAAYKASPGDEGGDDGGEPGGNDGAARKGSVSFADAYLKSGSAQNKGKEFELADVDVKTTFATSAGWATDVIRNPRFVDLATRPAAGIIDFMPTAPTTQSAIMYMEETTFTNAAVEVAEGAAKPEATLALTERTATVRKIAVFLPVTDEQLEDVEAVRAYLNQRLGFMVRQRLSGQVLVGDGSAPNLRGILNTSGIQTQAKGADPTPDAVYKAMTKIRVTGQAEPDAVVFHPNDWQEVRLLRTADGLYIWGNPSEAGPEMIWGLNVIQDQAETENTAVVGAWREFSTLFIRKGLTVETGYNASDWTTNKQTIRAEMRAVPVFWRPAAFCTVTGV
jgi:HK97 family phage major capsid protein